MSQTPLEESDTVESYSAAWGAVAWLLGKGQTWSGKERNGAFMGRGDGTFQECGAILGLDQIGDGRSVVRVDWDGDGDLDLFLRARNSPRLLYLENRLPRRGNSVSFKLVNGDPSQTEIGARLTVRASGEDGPVWIRTRRAGEGYLAQNSAWMNVGVGDVPEVQVEVRWPGGQIDSYGSVAANSSHVLVMGEPVAREWIRPTGGEVAGENTRRPEASANNNSGSLPMEGRVVLAAPLPLPHIPVTTSAGAQAVLGGVAESLHGPARREMIILLWSETCAPCLRELAEWSEARDSLAESGLSVLALELVSDGAQPKGSPWLDSIQWPYARGFCSVDSARIFAALTSNIMGSTRPLAVPLAFLVDGYGRAQVLYRGGVSAEQVLKDRAIFSLAGPSRLRVSFPFDGLYLDPYKQPDWVVLARSFRASGLPEVAKEFELALVKTDSLDSAESQFEFGQARLRQRNYELALKHYAEAVKAAPEVVRYLEPLGICQYQLGQIAEARVTFESVLRLDPRNQNTLFNLGYLLIQTEQWEPARKRIQQLRPLNQTLAAKLRQAWEEAQLRRKDEESTAAPTSPNEAQSDGSTEADEAPPERR